MPTNTTHGTVPISVTFVLFVDFVKPLKFPANLVNWLLLNIAAFTPFMRDAADNQRQWERRFYGRNPPMPAAPLSAADRRPSLHVRTKAASA